MNTKKFNTTLQKLNDFFGAVKRNPGDISTIERDLLKSYLRKLYELSLEENSLHKSITKKSKKQKPAEEKFIEQVTERKEEVKIEIEEKLEPIVEEIVEDSVIEELVEESQETKNPELEALFEEAEVKELSDKLSLSPIKNLAKGMGINEKIFTIQELFGGDQKAFDATMKDLNNLPDFKDAKDLLIGGVAEKYEWANPGTKKKAKNFIRFIRRRYT